MKQIPIKAIVWQNGMLMVFDQQGQQVPEYQGEANKILAKLIKDFPECAIRGERWPGTEGRDSHEG